MTRRGGGFGGRGSAGLAAVAFFAAFLAGCAAYHPKPLDGERLDSALAVPDNVTLAQEAARLRHPRIPPIALDFSQPLTGKELAAIAVLVNPELKALRAEEGVAEAQVFRAGLLPDPQFSFGLDHPLDGPPDLVNAFNAGLGWDLAKVILRGTGRRIAERDRERIRYDVAWREWLAANRVRLLAERAAYLGKRERVARKAAEAAARILEITRSNLNRGDAKIDEFGLRQVAYLDAEDRALSLARDLEKTRQELNRRLGFPPGRTIPVAATALADPPSRDAGTLFAEARRQRLDLIALQAGYAAQEERVYREVLRQFPAFTLGVSRARDTSDIRTIGFTVGLDLPLWNRNRGGIAVARATRERLYAEYVSRLHSARADIAGLSADLERIGRQRAVLARELPELERAEQTMRDAVANGDVTLLAYEAVRAALLDKRLALLSLEQAAAEQQVALQLAVGAPWNP
ncbi:MAG: TolC family protein [Deltaproteobacteria bacterium]|nr:TolC family protein [Deltaproteobacteria bacterium]